MLNPGDHTLLASIAACLLSLKYLCQQIMAPQSRPPISLLQMRGCKCPRDLTTPRLLPKPTCSDGTLSLENNVTGSVPCWESCLPSSLAKVSNSLWISEECCPHLLSPSHPSAVWLEEPRSFFKGAPALRLPVHTSPPRLL